LSEGEKTYLANEWGKNMLTAMLRKGLHPLLSKGLSWGEKWGRGFWKKDISFRRRGGKPPSFTEEISILYGLLSPISCRKRKDQYQGEKEEFTCIQNNRPAEKGGTDV